MKLDACIEQGRPDDAHEFARRAAQWALENGGVEEPGTAECLALIARILVDRGNFAEAEEYAGVILATELEYGQQQALGDRALAYSYLKQGKMEEAVEAQKRVTASDDVELDDVLLLMKMYEDQGLYQDATKLSSKATSIGWAESRGTSSELEKPGLAKSFIVQTRISVATGDLKAAKQMGTLALSRTFKWSATNYLHAKMYLECLEAMEMLYEAWGEEEKVQLDETRFMVSIPLTILVPLAETL